MGSRVLQVVWLLLAQLCWTREEKATKWFCINSALLPYRSSLLLFLKRVSSSPV